MKNLSKFICTIFTFILCFNFVSCKNKSEPQNPQEIECEHTYSFSGLSIEETSEIERPGIYTCSKCDETKTETITYEEIGLPVIDFSCSLSGISKENELKISIKYTSNELNFDCDAKIKVQGNTSAGFPKKNYTIKLYKKDTDFDKKFKVELVDGWGEENKYCLKANYIDYSQARNIVSAKLFSQVVKSRNNNSKLEELYNGGAIDGYPVVIYHNGSFLGLYTMNIPKDKWLFDMNDYDPNEDESIRKEAILVGDGWTNSVKLEESINPDFISSGWELEFCSTEEDDIGTSWVYESFNKFITFLNTSDDSTIKSNLKNYIDIQSAIDCYLYTNVIFAEDNVGKNMMYITYDGGKTWSLSMYDMDGTWGLMWNGYLYNEEYSIKTIVSHNKLYETLERLFLDEISNRYFELRTSVLSISNIMSEFESFLTEIPDFVRDAEKSKWINVPSQETNNLDQIIKFAGLKLSYLDEYFIF